MTDAGYGDRPNLGLATTQELLTELATRADVAAIAGEDWPKYRTTGPRPDMAPQLMVLGDKMKASDGRVWKIVDNGNGHEWAPGWTD